MSLIRPCYDIFCLLVISTVCCIVCCEQVNVALGQPTESSSVYNPAVPASVAVDGVTKYDNQCVETAQYYRTPYWLVHLNNTYTISSITVYRRALWSSRTEGLMIYVDGQLCHTISHDEAYTPQPTYGPPVAIDVQCNTTRTGRQVMLLKNYTGSFSDLFPEILSVCEVQVWVAAPTTTATTTSTTTPTTTSTPTTTTTTTTTPKPTPTPTPPTTPKPPLTTKPTTTTQSPTTSTTSQPNTSQTGVQTPSTEITTSGNQTTEGYRDTGKESGGHPVALIAGVSVGGLVLVTAILIGLVFVIRRRRKAAQDKSEEGGDTADCDDITTTDGDNHTTSLESPPAAVISDNNNTRPVKPAKPVIAVKPTLPATKSYPSTPTHNGVVTPQPTPSPSTSPQATYARHRTAPSTPEAEVQGDDVSLADGDHVYANREEVYSVFRQSAPQLDNVQSYLVDRLASNHLYRDFKTLEVVSEKETRTVGRTAANAKKNRFPNVVPYDSNRVALEDGYKAGSSNDYINASYIKGFKSEKGYIAAQGPMDHTTGDLWRMVWQEKITEIVMLTNLKEGLKDKCTQYWPEVDCHVTYGPVTVTTTHVDCRDNYYIRTFSVKRKNSRETREVTQYHYVSWPDHGVPTTVSLVRFWRDVTRRRHRGKSGEPPVLVHCSAGVGRSGTYIGLDLAMQGAVKDGEVDLVRLVTSLREQRCLMVQTTDQFLFLHSALLEAYTSRDYVYDVDTLHTVLNTEVDPVKTHTRLDKEFKMLMEMRSLAPEPCHVTASQPENVNKNRDPNNLPADEHLVWLSEDVPDQNHYIHAVFMPTLRSSRGSVVTQLPLTDTVPDLWRLVYSYDVTTVVSLSSAIEEEDSSLAGYWPRKEGEVVSSGPYTVTCLSLTRLTEHLTSCSLSLTKTGVTSCRFVTLLHYVGWTDKTGGNPDNILHLVDTLVTSHSVNTSSPYVVQCLDGVEKSGLFCALCYVINRMTLDRTVDVYMTVRHVQSVTPNAVTSEAQYRYLYQVVQHRCHEMGLGVYANQP